MHELVYSMKYIAAMAVAISVSNPLYISILYLQLVVPSILFRNGLSYSKLFFSTHMKVSTGNLSLDEGMVQYRTHGSGLP